MAFVLPVILVGIPIGYVTWSKAYGYVDQQLSHSLHGKKKKKKKSIILAF
jgi:hypothetical protein